MKDSFTQVASACHEHLLRLQASLHARLAIWIGSVSNFCLWIFISDDWKVQENRWNLWPLERPRFFMYRIVSLKCSPESMIESARICKHWIQEKLILPYNLGKIKHHSALVELK